MRPVPEGLLSSVKDFNKWRYKHQYDWIDLREFDFQKLSLRGINLKMCLLTGANFSDVNLEMAKLNGSRLTESIMVNATLIGAELPGCQLNLSNLTGANLTEANLTNADLSNANLRNACLKDADLLGANIGGANFLGVDDLLFLPIADVRGHRPFAQLIDGEILVVIDQHAYSPEEIVNNTHLQHNRVDFLRETYHNAMEWLDISPTAGRWINDQYEKSMAQELAC